MATYLKSLAAVRFGIHTRRGLDKKRAKNIMERLNYRARNKDDV
jgi:hypothetical protein